MENKGIYKDDQGLIPNDLRSGRERRKQERKAKWLECQKLESFYFGKLGKSRRSAVLKKKYNHG